MQIYLVGGAIRDRLLNLPVYDRDWVVVGSTPEEMQNLGYRQVGKDFPVFIHPQTGEEYALARTERKTAPGHTGFSVHSSPQVSLEEDLVRRDLTINAIAEDTQGEIIDPMRGQEDLAKKILRHISPAFAEDPLRVFRVARFAAKLADQGFSIAPETLSLMQKISTSEDLSYLSKERIWQETYKALATDSPEIYFDVLLQCDALPQFSSELATALLQLDKHGSLNQLKQLDDTDARYVALLVISAKRENTIDINFIENQNDIFGVPSHLAALATLAGQYYFACLQALTLSGEEILHLLTKLDVFRRTQRSLEILAHISAVNLLLSQGKTHSLDFLTHLIPDLVQLKLAPKEQEKLHGKAIGEALAKLRCAYITAQKEAYK